MEQHKPGVDEVDLQVPAVEVQEQDLPFEGRQATQTLPKHEMHPLRLSGSLTGLVLLATTFLDNHTSIPSHPHLLTIRQGTKAEYEDD